MKLSKAIEILTQLERTLAPTMSADGTDAIKLGIAAIKRVLANRQPIREHWKEPLPGETKEQQTGLYIT